jgi:hypothetical protein
MVLLEPLIKTGGVFEKPWLNLVGFISARHDLRSLSKFLAGLR